MDAAFILILVIVSIGIIMIVVLNKLIIRKIKRRNEFINKIKVDYPNFIEINQNSLYTAIEFNNGRHILKVYRKIDPLKIRKYTFHYKCLLEISHFKNEEKDVIMDKFRSFLNVKPIFKNESIYVDITRINNYDKLYYFIKNYMNEKNT